MKYWQEQYESILGSGMSEDERKKQLKALRDAIATAKEGYVNSAQAVMDLLGLGASSEQEATMNMADKITYDQADQLLGINLAQELTLEQILATLRGTSPVISSDGLFDSQGYYPALDSLVGSTQANDEQTRQIASTLQALADVQHTGNDNILTQVAMANSYLEQIQNYSKKIFDKMDMHMASMDSKLSNLSRL